MIGRRTLGVPTRCGCFSVRCCTIGFAVYSLILSVFLLAQQLTEAVPGAVHQSGLLFGFLISLLMLAISVAAIIGVLKNREGLLIPFLVFSTLNLVLSILVAFGCLLQLSCSTRFLFLGTTHPYYLVESEFVLLLLKICQLRCVWICYKHIQACHQARQQLPDKEKGLFLTLPIYQEALNPLLKNVLPPPPYLS